MKIQIPAKIMAKLPVEKVLRVLNERNPRERTMLLGLAIVMALALDYMVFIRPVVGGLFKVMPELSQAKQDLAGLKEDRNNEALIRKRWESATRTLVESEKAFVGKSEVPALLEKLSQLALSSGVRIMAVNPVESKMGGAARYAPVPIRISAIAGTHELGRFLAKLEGGETFFKVSDVNITASPADERRHVVQVEVTAYTKGPS